MARTIHYDDLVLAVEPAPAGGYQVRVLSSPYGPAVAPFPLFAERARMEELIRVARAAVMATPEARHVGALEVANAPERDPREVGDVLFRALFTGAVRETYLLSRGRSEAHADRGLRARLVLPAETADAGLVQALPWELLYCAETREFITRSALTPFVRILPLAWASAPLPAAEARPLRILIAVAAPRDTPVLDAGDERARILEALCRQQSAAVDVLQRASLSNLSAALANAPYHIVHFIGHGGFDAEAGDGFLLLEGADGRAAAVRGEVLAAVLRASRSLRLVFLNSCKGAEAGRRPDQDPLLATAAALVRGGAPAVIAMQFPISDVAARVFSAAVYLSLARGSSLEAAVGDGRMAMYQASPRSWEWITPVLLAAHAGTEVLRPVCLGFDAPAKECLDHLSTSSPELAAKLLEDFRGVLATKARAIDCSAATYTGLLDEAAKLSAPLVDSVVGALDGTLDRCRADSTGREAWGIGAVLMKRGLAGDAVAKAYVAATTTALVQARYADARMLAQQGQRVVPKHAADLEALLDGERRKVLSTMATIRGLCQSIKADPRYRSGFSWCFPAPPPPEIQAAKDGWGKPLRYLPQEGMGTDACRQGFALASYGAADQPTQGWPPTPASGIECRVSWGNEGWQLPAHVWLAKESR